MNIYVHQFAIRVCATVLLGCMASVVHAQVISIEEFVGKQAEWNRLVGTTWMLEGRYALIGAKNLKFMKCDMPFILDDGLPRVPTTTNVIQVTCKLEKLRDQLQMLVTSVQSRPSDIETLRFKRSLINPNEAQGWYDVAEWARRRSQFYNDQALLLESLNLFGEGIETEQRQLKPEDHAGMIALTRKAVNLGLGEKLTDYLRHAGYRRQFEALKKTEKPDYSLLLADISNFLKDSTKPQPAIPAQVAAAYQRDPQESYRQAEQTDRVRMNRLLYVDVVRARAEASLQPDGRNGDSIARQLEAQAPELGEFAKQIRDKYMQWQITRIDTLTRQELFEFVKLCEERQQGDVALEAKKKWLLAREPKLRADGARGLAELGEDWFSFLNDEAGAARYYMDAFAANSDYAPASDWLTAHKFVFAGGKWEKESAAPVALDETEQAVRDGRLELGMSEQAVREAMGANPTRTHRFASSGKILDLWVFEEARLIVRLERQRKDENSTVVAIEPIIDKAERRKQRSAK